jgi:hypothetical protein
MIPISHQRWHDVPCVLPCLPCSLPVPCLHLQVCAFLDKLGELRSLQPLAASMCRSINNLYDLDASQNYEVGGAVYHTVNHYPVDGVGT